MIERPSYASGLGESDKNAILSLIETTESSLEVLQRQKDSVSEASLSSIEAQIRAKQKLLEELKAKQVIN
ncbi:MAG: hypothetical protein NTX96_02690 [Candidatus Zambryskibacteria bacterium]|nr:hypothetical protein [Candidatus Zambryskibacteria bacterium]